MLFPSVSTDVDETLKIFQKAEIFRDEVKVMKAYTDMTFLNVASGLTPESTRCQVFESLEELEQGALSRSLHVYRMFNCYVLYCMMLYVP